MSPERISAGCGAAEAGAYSGYSYPSDIWGLGLSLLALALGRHPLAHVRTVWDVLAMQDAGDYQVPSLRVEQQASGRPRFTAAMCDFIECCLRRDPADRLSAEGLLAHPFLVPPLPLVSPSPLPLPSPQSVSDLISSTSDRTALRLMTAVLLRLNPYLHEKHSSTFDLRVGVDAVMSPVAPIGLSAWQLSRLCAQLPGMSQQRAQALQSQATDALVGAHATRVAAVVRAQAMRDERPKAKWREGLQAEQGVASESGMQSSQQSRRARSEVERGQTGTRRKAAKSKNRGGRRGGGASEVKDGARKEREDARAQRRVARKKQPGGD